jgi:hypothetical protein
MGIEPTANEIRGNVRLEIGECQDKIGLQGEDLVDIRRREGTYARLLAASLWWTHDIPGDTHDAVLLPEQVQRLDGLFGEADNFGLAGTPKTLTYSRSPTYPIGQTPAPQSCEIGVLGSGRWGR